MKCKIIELDELKKIELNLLVQFDEICRKNGFFYSLAGGTLIGAIRHKGFIPWDDDIDVLMPRPDYERFISHCENNHVPFRLISNRTIKDYCDLYAKAVNPDTVIKEDITDKDESINGVFIDIFPIDGLGSTKKEAIKNFRRTSFERELLNASFWNKFVRSKTRAWYYEPVRLVFFALSRFVDSNKLSKKIDKKVKQINYEDSAIVGSVYGSYREKEILEKSIYSDLIEVEFEGHMLYALKEYDTYLRALYGDYLKLPPKEKRVSHHYFDAYWKGESE